ncbi:MAG: Citrate transporter [Petrotoga mobilis]|nr:MAG: Citrate transporter [Petrotoga mobilis]
MSIYAITSLIVFIIVVLGMVFQKIDRTLIAMLGAIFLLGAGVFSDQIGAIKEYVDFNTLLLLLGMMVFVETLRKTGIFTFLGLSMLKLFGNNTYTLFISLIFLVALFSGFIDNVTTILVFIPMTFAITDSLKINYLPFILGEIFASNIGGMATIIGDPPNIMIASAAGYSFTEFALIMYPITIVNLIFVIILLIYFFKKDLSIKIDKEAVKNFDVSHIVENKKEFILSIFLFGAVIVAFALQHELNLESSTVALAAGFFSLFILRPEDLKDTLSKVEWENILFFFALFLIAGALEETGIISIFSNILVDFTGNSLLIFSFSILIISSFFTGFMNNVPLTAAMIPVIEKLTISESSIFTNFDPIWYSLSLGACLGGNLTPIAASANVIALGFLTQFKGKTISFWEFAKYGLIIVMGNILISAIYINFVFF